MRAVANGEWLDDELFHMVRLTDDDRCRGGCGGPAEPGLSMCRDCKARYAANRNELHARRRDAGLCPMCGDDPMPGRVHCETHLVLARGTVARRRDAGLCTKCGGTQDTDGRTCTRCRAKWQQRNARRRDAGLCTKCGGTQDTDGRTCTRCRERDALARLTARTARR